MPRPWRDAWQDALYGPAGFFIHSRPTDHFRTSVTSSDVFAAAIAQLVREAGLTAVVDLGAGGGELLARLHDIDPTLRLTGVEVAGRPDLPDDIVWTDELPTTVDGLLIAHEWLDNIPCDVVEVDDDGVVRLVEVDPDSGVEQLGGPVESDWLDRWWPLDEPGTRAEIGAPRDDAWADAVGRVHGIALAVDYGHLADARPPFGTLTSFAHGQEVDVVPDGSRDVTAHVAVDAVAARTGATLVRQRDALAELGVDGTRPSLDLATADPPAYVAALARASESAELRARGGWGDFWWLTTDTRVGD
ncbi:SAM-dependent methyltransferase [Aeromicrobium sp.]|uniref:SAM-dependent methyltransferase n=1 Tax=Aeromicrobium sp. TaxID=1871063 RepID=UPI003C653B84